MKKFLLIVLIVTVIALAVGIFSFIFNESAEFVKLFFSKEVGYNQDIEYYPIYDWFLNTSKYLVEGWENILYNVEYVIDGLF